MDTKRFGEYVLTTDRSKLDIPYIHDYLLNESYWAKGIDVETVKTSIEHSLCFGIFLHEGEEALGRQVGFARVTTDYATFAYLGDVFIDKAHRAKGLSKWLMQEVIDHPALQRLRSFFLFTKDAHGLYEQFGFKVFDNDEKRMMGIRRSAADLYS